MSMPNKRRSRPGATGRLPQIVSAGWLSAFCVGGYDDYNNVANGGTDTYSRTLATNFAATISPK